MPSMAPFFISLGLFSLAKWKLSVEKTILKIQLGVNTCEAEELSKESVDKRKNK